MDLSPIQTAALLFVVCFAGALLPLHRGWSDRGLHVFVSISAGVFLGTVFLHLLPHLAGVEVGEAHEAAHRLSGLPALAPWLAALAGLLLLFALEKVWLRSVAGAPSPDPHRALWAATWVGLGFHSFAEGIALVAILGEPSVRTQLMFSVLAHKATEAFSLATVMRLARLGRPRSILFLGLFALLGPLGILIGTELVSSGGVLVDVLTGFACGTFLYVALCDLLPEVFHGADRPWVKLASVGVGILATALTLPRLAWALEFAQTVGEQSLAIFLDIAPFLLLGFLIAGVLSQVIRPTWLTRHVAGEDLRSVTIASLIGAPLPLCSCSVVPVAVSMRRDGASKGATTSFLVATPETGVDSISVSWALLGPLLTVFRVVGAVVSAIFAGGVVSWFARREGRDRAPAPADTTAACAHGDGRESEGLAGADEVAVPSKPWWSRVLRYALVEMMDDLAGSIVVGVLVSGVLAAAVPPELFRSPLAQGFPGLLLMLVLGIPIYVCAAGSTPIAATLILKGMSPGAALVFLLASPATNLGSLIVLSRHLGGRTIALHAIALASVTLAIGWGVDLAYTGLGIEPAASIGSVASVVPRWFTVGTAALLGGFLLVSIFRTRASLPLFRRLGEDPHPPAHGARDHGPSKAPGGGSSSTAISQSRPSP